MAKVAGFPMTLEVDDTTNTLQDISTDVNNTTWNTPRAIQDVTGLDKSAHERIFLLADFTITLNGAGFDAASNKAHEVLKTISNSTVTRAIHLELPTGTNLFSADPVCVFEEYQLNRGADGGITWSARGSLANRRCCCIRIRVNYNYTLRYHHKPRLI